jgi:hypothetical protein
VHAGFSWENLVERDFLEEAGIDGRIILKWIFNKWDWGIKWIDLVQDRVKSFWVPYNEGNFLTG